MRGAQRTRARCAHGLWTRECEPCRKRYQREHAQRSRQRTLAAKNAGRKTCALGHGAGICGAVLEHRTDELGRVSAVCPKCERRRRGICRDCPRPVYGQVGRAIRCAGCAECAQREQVDAHKTRNKESILARGRARRAVQRAANDPKHLAKLEDKRAWRAANPEKIRKQKRRALIRHGRSRDRYLAHHRKLNAKKARQLRKRRQAMLAYYAEHPTRPVPRCVGCNGYLDWQPEPGGTCGRPPKWCDDCCASGERKRRVARGTTITALMFPPLVVYAPPLREIERKLAQPLCAGGCGVVLKGRAKKCDACKRRDVAAAALALEQRRGRGKRTDVRGAA